MNDLSQQRMTEWLQALPRNAVIGWTDAGMTEAVPFAREHVAVEIPELCATIGVDRVVTILEPCEPDEPAAGATNLWRRHRPRGRAWNAIDDLDYDVWCALAMPLYAGSWHSLALGPREIDINSLPPNPEWDSMLSRLQDSHDFIAVEAWSAPAISERLARLARDLCGRTDIRFRFDPELQVFASEEDCVECQRELALVREWLAMSEN